MVKTKIKSSPPSITNYLLIITLGLVIVNIFIQFAIYTFGLDKEWFLLFNMDKEVNIPTLFSCILLLICSALISLVLNKIKRKRKNLQYKWKVLQWIFIFLALDEGLQIHEAFIIPGLKPILPALLTVVWVIPYGIFSIFLIIYFIPLIRSLPSKLKYLTLFSGITYVSGALGLEMLGSYLVRTGDIRLHGISYGLIITVEETLEIIGLIIFIYSLLTYIFEYQKQNLKVEFKLERNKKNIK